MNGVSTGRTISLQEKGITLRDRTRSSTRRASVKGGIARSGLDTAAGRPAAGAVRVQVADTADDRTEILLREGSDLQVVDLDQVVLLGGVGAFVTTSLVHWGLQLLASK